MREGGREKFSCILIPFIWWTSLSVRGECRLKLVGESCEILVSFCCCAYVMLSCVLASQLS